MKRVCIVGAGASGIAAARVLAADFSVRILDRNADFGGTWIYRPAHGPDLQSAGSAAPGTTCNGTEPGEEEFADGAMYDGLRTNIPANDLMVYRDLPFPEGTAAFPEHTVVLDYLRSAAKAWGLEGKATFGVWVERVRKRGDKWTVEWRPVGAKDAPRMAEEFDFVCAANGHYFVPHLPAIPGLFGPFAGRVLHSRDFRDPGEFHGQSVLVVGGGSSGIDIARIIAGRAAKVVLSARSLKGAVPAGVELVPKIVRFGPSGVELAGGRTLPHPDAVLLATGYDYSFPFLYLPDRDPLGLPPLYMNLFLAADPTLAFLGLPTKVIPFPLAEHQAELVRAVWTGRAVVPDPEGCLLAEREWLEVLRSRGVAVSDDKGDRRRMDLDGELQWILQDRMAAMAGTEPTEGFRWEVRRTFAERRRRELGY
ncbi:hypothetical protein DFJ74DRAFT_500016 [Hyaloraphidium curvatum]|nr:hypothetical protein DFJ74DRAFT_500016 [Hyaloraphidium curvatum]